MATPVEPKPKTENNNLHSRTGGQGAIDPVRVSAEAPAPDLVETLRAEGRHFRGEPDCVGPAVTLLVERAAAEISRLTAEVERLTADNVRLGQWDVAADERIQLIKENERLRAVADAAAALIADVRRRYPGEELRCEYMKVLDAALKEEPRT
jgi:hypothetical protein